MAQGHLLIFRVAEDKPWQFSIGDLDRIWMLYLTKREKRLNPQYDFRLIRAKSLHDRDIEEALKLVNSTGAQWRDGRGGDQKTGKRGNREGIRYG